MTQVMLCLDTDVIGRSDQVPEEAWYTIDEIEYFKKKALSTSRQIKCIPKKKRDEDVLLHGRGLEFMMCRKRQRDMVSARKKVLKTQKKLNKKDGNNVLEKSLKLAQASCKATQEAKMIAIKEGTANDLTDVECNISLCTKIDVEKSNKLSKVFGKRTKKAIFDGKMNAAMYQRFILAVSMKMMRNFDF